jgi:alpha-L-arabinofuranosidase
MDCTLALGDRLPNGAFDATVLAGDSPDAYNDTDHPEQVVPERTRLEFRDGLTKLPPHSLSIVTIRVKR